MVNPAPSAMPLSREEFEATYARLRRELAAGADNPGSFNCTDCEDCLSCMFCTSCVACFRSTHCTECEACTGSSHCLRCVGCHACSHCVDSASCTGSAYLVSCVSCSDCTYCTGCVGLSKKEFHILNEPYGRTEYFAMLKALGLAAP